MCVHVCKCVCVCLLKSEELHKPGELGKQVLLHKPCMARQGGVKERNGRGGLCVAMAGRAGQLGCV